MPKSSSAMRQPSWRSRLQRALHRGGVLHQQRLGDLDLDAATAGTPGRGRFRLDDARRIPVQQLLAGDVDGHRNGEARDPCHFRNWRQAARTTQLLMSRIRPLSSAISTKRLGEMSPYSASRQRSSASTPTSWLSLQAELRLEHQVQQIVVNGAPQPRLQLQPVAQAAAHGRRVDGDRRRRAGSSPGTSRCPRA